MLHLQSYRNSFKPQFAALLVWPVAGALVLEIKLAVNSLETAELQMLNESWK